MNSYDWHAFWLIRYRVLSGLRGRVIGPTGRQAIRSTVRRLRDLRRDGRMRRLPA